MVSGCGSPEMCQGLSLSSSCPNFLLAMNGPPNAGQGRHSLVCSETSPPPVPSPPLRPSCPEHPPPAQIPAWTRSSPSATQRIWLFFPPKPPVSAGGSSRSHQSHPDTSHWLRINQASATSSSLSGEATAPLPRDGPSSLELPFRATQGQPHLYRGFSRRQKSSSSSGCACRDGGCGDGGGLESSECSLERRRSLALFLSSCIFYKVLPQKYKITRYM